MLPVLSRITRTLVKDGIKPMSTVSGKRPNPFVQSRTNASTAAAAGAEHFENNRVKGDSKTLSPDEFRPLYLDAQATTPLDPRVLDKMMPFLMSQYGNPHSRTHAYGWESEAAMEHARKQVAAIIGADPREIIFTSGATESNNISVKGTARFYKSKKNHVITTQTRSGHIVRSIFLRKRNCVCRKKKKILDNEEAERKKKEKRELAREKKRHQQEEKEAQKRRKEEALVEKKKKEEEMQAKKENAKRKKELERMKMKMKKGKRSSYVSSSNSDDEVMEMLMNGMGEEDEVGVSKNDDKCAGCGTVGEPSILWIQFEKCSLWWHSRCTNLKDLNEEELKKAPFACCYF
ncbi:cysteine desulfurase, mitochondrial [Plakobranchus ocellatus]|uniref:Cysteine desulfurase, mitochondrial n=1 Tax=Plakobranchus ocellatus TaxID=259542 RepID=A0AAV3YU64_9GAST|nr:cysteine desulfurase, mitochondrial [Plakobranchus ocellatus]